MVDTSVHSLVEDIEADRPLNQWEDRALVLLVGNVGLYLLSLHMMVVVVDPQVLLSPLEVRLPLPLICLLSFSCEDNLKLINAFPPWLRICLISVTVMNAWVVRVVFLVNLVLQSNCWLCKLWINTS